MRSVIGNGNDASCDGKMRKGAVGKQRNRPFWASKKSLRAGAGIEIHPWFLCEGFFRLVHMF